MKLKIISRRSLARGSLLLVRNKSAGAGNPDPPPKFLLPFSRASGTRILSSRLSIRGLIRGHQDARDWPDYTCSVRPNIIMDRDNDRWITTLIPAEIKRGGRVMPGL